MSQLSLLQPDDLTGAWFSTDRRWRYALWRSFKPSGPQINWLMLNPSTADEFTNDPTIQRCMSRSWDMGYGRVVITNLFAWRSTDPQGMLSAENPIGPSNDEAIIKYATESDRVVCGWGSHGGHLGRSEYVLGLLSDAGVEPYALRVNDDNQPGHPLYLSYALELKPYSELLMGKVATNA